MDGWIFRIKLAVNGIYTQPMTCIIKGSTSLSRQFTNMTLTRATTHKRKYWGWWLKVVKNYGHPGLHLAEHY